MFSFITNVHAIIIMSPYIHLAQCKVSTFQPLEMHSTSDRTICVAVAAAAASREKKPFLLSRLDS